MIGKDGLVRLGLAVCCLIASPAIAQEDSAEAGIRQLEGVQAALQRAIERAQPSIVSIFIVQKQDVAVVANGGLPRNQINMLRAAEDQRTSTFGSGVIVHPDGFVLTCYHVVRPVMRENQFQIEVRDQSGASYTGKIHAADPRSDLAVIELQGKLKRPMPAIKIGDGSKLFRGQFVLAVGNPYGIAADGSTSASMGIISNIRRRPAPSMAASDDQPSLYEQSGTLVQTDARLNMGISGGALINIRGEMIGVTMALSAAAGFETPGGFALPTDEITRRTIDTLVAGKEMEYGFLGITPTSLEAGSPRGLVGVRVYNVIHGLPAQRAGLQAGDVIMTVNGREMREPGDLILAVGSLPVGTILDVKILRPGEAAPKMLKLPLAKYPVRGDVVATNKGALWNGIRVDHLSTLPDLSAPRFGNDLNLLSPDGRPIPGGVVVREVQDKSPAFEKGIRPHQVILKVNGEMVQTPEEFEQAVSRAKPPIRLTMFRGSEQVFDGKEATPKAERKNEN